MYPYHNKIKQRINEGELLYYYLTEDYPNIGKALVFVFCSPPFLRPVRPRKWDEYFDFLKNILPEEYKKLQNSIDN